MEKKLESFAQRDVLNPSLIANQRFSWLGKALHSSHIFPSSSPILSVAMYSIRTLE